MKGARCLIIDHKLKVLTSLDCLQVLAINEIANLTALEADGTYYAYTCSSKSHKHHQNLQDSVYKQSLRQGMMFTEMMKNGIYINQPELFFFFGGHKSGQTQREGHNPYTHPTSMWYTSKSSLGQVWAMTRASFLFPGGWISASVGKLCTSTPTTTSLARGGCSCPWCNTTGEAKRRPSSPWSKT